MAGNLGLKQFEFGPFAVNTFVVWDKRTLDAIIIDPGCWNADEENALESFISAGGLKPLAVINTHCHIDHIFGNAFAKKMWQVPLLVPEHDAPLLAFGPKQAELFGFTFSGSPKEDGFLDPLGMLEVGGLRAELIHTPGHTKGEFCLYFRDEAVLIAGDVLFREGIGRTDLWGGSHDELLSAIRTKLLVLPGETVVYPGHGEPTTIEHEKISNPYL